MPRGDVARHRGEVHRLVGGERALLTLLVRAEVERALAIAPVALAGFTLAPGGDVELARAVDLPAGDLAVGRALSLTLLAGVGGGDEDDACIVDAPRFDAAFQEVAFFQRPRAIERGARGTLSCAWDTGERTTPTRWGEGSLDEMCTVFLFLAAPD